MMLTLLKVSMRTEVIVLIVIYLKVDSFSQQSVYIYIYVFVITLVWFELMFFKYGVAFSDFCLN